MILYRLQGLAPHKDLAFHAPLRSPLSRAAFRLQPAFLYNSRGELLFESSGRYVSAGCCMSRALHARSISMVHPRIPAPSGGLLPAFTWWRDWYQLLGTVMRTYVMDTSGPGPL